MKKYLLVLSIIGLFVSCGQSQEDKANAIIKAELRKSLYLPDTYKPIETKVDSAFAPHDDPALYDLLTEIGKMGEEVGDLERDMKSAKSSMAIWSGPYQSNLGRIEYDEAKEKYDKANEKIEKIREKALGKIQDFNSIISQKKKFIGYRVTHNYRADNNAGNTLIGNEIFIIDPEFKNVLFHCEVDEYNDYQKAIKEFQESIEESKQK